MNEAIAAQIETVLRTKGGTPSAKVFIKENYGTIIGKINRLAGWQMLDAVELVITCDSVDVERIKTVMGMIPNVRLLTAIHHFDSEMLLYGSTQT